MSESLSVDRGGLSVTPVCYVIRELRKSTAKRAETGIEISSMFGAEHKMRSHYT
jgi:hypothetical protein